jgi:hypothetical protein
MLDRASTTWRFRAGELVTGLKYSDEINKR